MIKASIVITAYNSAAFIERSLQSALTQQFPKSDYEIVVIDDGSTDETPQILARFGNAIRVIRQANRGFVGAANAGFRAAVGTYVTKLDSDDAFGPDLLRETTDVLDANPEIDFVYSDYEERMGDVTRVVSTENIFSSIAIGMMYRRERLAAEGCYREGLKFPEYDLLLRTLGRWKGFRIPKPLFTYIRRPESVTKETGWQEDALRELRALYPEHRDLIAKIRKY
ncbi:MAG: glycosyltransferase family A protein [bacterium]|nr:glycosyltransferase family A protein [bacterium]